MKLTAEQETQFLNEHEKKICDFVNRYQRKAGKRYPDNTEDLLQEARQALLLLLRNADSLAEAEHYYIHVTHALYEYVRRMAAVKIPQKKFKMEIRNIFLYSLDVFEFDATSSSFEDMIIGNIDYERFLSCLLPLDAKMLSMRMKGSSQKNIADAVGLCESQVCRRIHRLGNQYRCFMEGCCCAG